MAGAGVNAQGAEPLRAKYAGTPTNNEKFREWRSRSAGRKPDDQN